MCHDDDMTYPTGEERKAMKAERRRQDNIDRIIQRARCRTDMLGGEEFLPPVAQDCAVLADEVIVLRQALSHVKYKYNRLVRAIPEIR